MYDVINNLYHLIVSLQMETGNVPDRSNNISVSIVLQNVMDRHGTDQKYNYKNIIRYKTCYKNPENPKCIYLMMTNISKSFQNSLAIETGLSDIHKMCLTVLKIFYSKQKSHIIHYQSYKKFSNVALINDLQNIFSIQFWLGKLFF